MQKSGDGARRWRDSHPIDRPSSARVRWILPSNFLCLDDIGVDGLEDGVIGRMRGAEAGVGIADTPSGTWSKGLVGANKIGNGMHREYRARHT